MLWWSPTSVTPLGCALTKNASVSALECALTKSLDLKSPEMNSYKKPGGAPRCLGDLRLLIGVISVTCGLRRSIRVLKTIWAAW